MGQGATKIGSQTCGGSIRALEPATGKLIWQTCLPVQVVEGLVLLPRLCLVLSGSRLFAIKNANGAVLFNQTFVGSFFGGIPSVADGKVFLPDQSGGLIALVLPAPSASQTAGAPSG
jgi:outer membrane protein assembly factor BamB